MAGADNLVNISTLSAERQREIRSMGGKASQAKKKRNKMIAEALREVLEQPISQGSEQTRLDGIAVKAIRKLFDNPSMKDIKALAEILGEVKQTIQHEGLQVNVNASPEGEENIKQILGE